MDGEGAVEGFGDEGRVERQGLTVLQVGVQVGALASLQFDAVTVELCEVLGVADPELPAVEAQQQIWTPC